MLAKKKLKLALIAIDDAKESLEKNTGEVGGSAHVRAALRELNAAESYIKNAIREIPNE